MSSRLVDHVVVGQDEAGLVDDEAGAGARLQRAVLVVGLRGAGVRAAAAALLTSGGALPKNRRSRSSLPSCRSDPGACRWAEVWM